MTLLQRLRGAPAMRRLVPRAGDAPVSVVIPLYQHARYVAAALDSVLAQTAPPHEILVIDDGSGDDGARIAERALRGVAPVRVLRQPNRGAAATINEAVRQADADWIAVLNSDDLFLPDKLAHCQLAIAGQQTELVAGGVALIDARGERLAGGVAADWLRRAHDFAARAAHPPLALLNENFVATTSNMVFTRALWRRLGGFAQLRYCHDLDFLLRAFACVPVVIAADTPQVLYRVHEQNTIAEDVRGVRVELAAVIAEALHTLGPRLLPSGGDDGFAAFAEFLRNKAVSDLVLYFAALRLRFADAHDFYRHVTAEPQRRRFLDAC